MSFLSYRHVGRGVVAASLCSLLAACGTGGPLGVAENPDGAPDVRVVSVEANGHKVRCELENRGDATAVAAELPDMVVNGTDVPSSGTGDLRPGGKGEVEFDLGGMFDGMSMSSVTVTFAGESYDVGLAGHEASSSHTAADGEGSVGIADVADVVSSVVVDEMGSGAVADGSGLVVTESSGAYDGDTYVVSGKVTNEGKVREDIVVVSARAFSAEGDFIGSLLDGGCTGLDPGKTYEFRAVPVSKLDGTAASYVIDAPVNVR